MFERIHASIPYIIGGIKVTLFFSTISFAIGFTLGLFLCILRKTDNKFVNYLVSIYVSIFRGTPIILQLGMLYYSAKPILGFNLTIAEAGITCFSLNSAAYVSEILKAGFASVPKIQTDICYSLNISKFHQIKDIFLPQAVKNVLPALINEMVDLIKESAVISTISGMDLMRRAYQVANNHHTYFEPFILAAMIYYAMVFFFTSIAKLVEKCIL